MLIADEPTTALDVTIQAQVLDLINDLQKRFRMAILFITHDLAVVKQVADHVAVMKDGVIVEESSNEVFFSAPQHAYSWDLFAALPAMEKRGRPLLERNHVPDKPADSNFTENDTLRVRDLAVYFPIRKGLFKRTVGYVKA